jgi:hypothetical protein
MITITQEAQEFLCGIEYPEGKILRLEEDWELGGKRRASFHIGEPEDDDEVLEREGETLLHFARSVSEAFDGFVVTRVEMREGVGITLSPPYAGKFSW